MWRLLKIEVPSDPAIPYLDTDPEKTKILKDTSTPKIMATLGTIAKKWRQPKCRRTNEYIQKMGYIDTLQCYSDIKKDGITPFPVTGKKLEMIILTEIRQEKTSIIGYHFW